MFIGEYTHTLDPKKRLSLPSKWRAQLGKKVILTRGLDKCIFVYTRKEWESFVEKLNDLSFGKAGSRNFNRFILSSASEADVDGSGRILIPNNLKTFAGLTSKVVLAGVGNRLEIWNEKSWRENTRLIEKQADQLAESLGELGMI